MAQGNTTILVGNATRDPELRFTPSGTAVCNFGIAINRRFKNKQTGEYEDADPSFFDVVAWQDLAENVAESVTKGTRVMIEGRLEQRSWDDKDTGDKRYKIEVIADDVAPSLKWSTAQVTKVDRRDNNGGGGNSGGGGGGRSGGGSRDGGGGGRGRDGGNRGNSGGGGQADNGPDFFDEEPF